MKAAVVYWSGTGNTAAMADLVLEGMQSAGADAELLECGSVTDLSAYDAIAFGCPAMGSEQLEDSEFEPMFDSVKKRSQAKGSRFSAPTAGVTESGCAAGRRNAARPASGWSARASSSTAHPRARMPRPAGNWGRRWSETRPCVTARRDTAVPSLKSHPDPKF